MEKRIQKTAGILAIILGGFIIIPILIAFFNKTLTEAPGLALIFFIVAILIAIVPGIYLLITKKVINKVANYAILIGSALFLLLLIADYFYDGEMMSFTGIFGIIPSIIYLIGLGFLIFGNKE